MRRAETTAALVALAVVASYAALVVLASRWLNEQGWFGASSNLIQHYSGPGLFAGIGVAAWSRWHSRCGYGRCIRKGEHPVSGTRQKVCHHHHRVEHHEAVHDEHGGAEGLAWGESHGRETVALYEKGLIP